MKNNVGTLDAALRLIVGFAILSLVFVGPQTWLGLFGLIPIATAILGTCPLYSVLGLSTCTPTGRHRPT